MEKEQKATGERLLYTILYLIIGHLATMVICMVVIVQFVYSWVGDEVNTRLLSFTASLSEYVKQLVSYISFNSDEKPWPMSAWPEVT